MDICICKTAYASACVFQLGVKALTVEDLLQAQKEISAHNRQLKEQTKQLERDMALLRDHSLLLVRPQALLGCCCHSASSVISTCCFSFHLISCKEKIC